MRLHIFCAVSRFVENSVYFLFVAGRLDFVADKPEAEEVCFEWMELSGIL